MPVFRCLIRGENIELDDLDDGGVPKLKGFYATRWVRAANTKRAELKAVDLLRKEYRSWLKSPSEEIFDVDAKMYLEKIEIVKRKPWSIKNKGAVWFDMDDSGENGSHQPSLEFELEASLWI